MSDDLRCSADGCQAAGTEDSPLYQCDGCEDWFCKYHIKSVGKKPHQFYCPRCAPREFGKVKAKKKARKKPSNQFGDHLNIPKGSDNP